MRGPHRREGPPRPPVGRALAAYCLAAATLDGATGLLLIAAPRLTLRLMGVLRGPAEDIWLRFAGAFVAGVGAAYLVPFLDRRAGAEAVEAVLAATALVRLAVGGVVGAAVAAGELAPQWITVAATDLALAAVQVAILLRRRRR